MKTFLYWEPEFSMENQSMEINVTNDEYCKGDPENKIMTLKKFIEMRQMTLSDPKFDIKKSRDTLVDGRRRV